MEGPAPDAVRSLLLKARPLTAESIAPLGWSLGPGTRAELGCVHRGLLSVDVWRPGGLTVSQLQRYPSTRRLVMPLSGVALVVLVLGPSGGEPADLRALTTAPGQGLMIEAGVWHAGPVVLEEGSVGEILDAPGVADCVDVAPLSALADVDVVSVELPGAEGEAAVPLDLGALGSVDLSPVARGVVAAGFLRLVDVELGPPDAELVRQCADARGRRAEEEGLVLRDNLHAATLLVAANRGLRILVADAALAEPPLRLRLGQPKERIRDEEGRRSSVRGEPVLCDRDGILGSARAGARRSLPTAETEAVVVTVFLDPSTPVDDAGDHLDAVSRMLGEVARGREASRLVVGLAPAAGGENARVESPTSG